MALALGPVAASWGCGGDPGARGAGSGPGDAPEWARAYARIVAVEDARGASPPRELSGFAGHADPRVRAWAVRGLGRIGDPSLSPLALPFLGDADPDVRVEAAHALAALRAAGEAGGPLFDTLMARAGDPEEAIRVRAEAAHALVRTAREASDLASADRVLLELAAHPALEGAGEEASRARLALARASELRARRDRGGRGRYDDRPVLGVLALSAGTEAGDPVRAARTRRLLVAALRTRGPVPPGVLASALEDPDAGVRREAVAALGPGTALADAGDRLTGSLDDPDPGVRLEALRRWDRWLRAERGCGPLRDAVEDPHPHVALTALDLLAAPCPDAAARRRLLMEVADAGGTAGTEGRAAGTEGGAAGTASVGGAGGWHRRAHALEALAAVAPDEAQRRLPEAANHPSPFFRARAARAAGRTGDTGLLRLLVGDPDPNVRSAALEGLAGRVGHEADPLVRAQLAFSDPGLVLTAVRLLGGTPDPEPAAEAMTAALLRFTATRRETVRDVRLALLDGLAALRTRPPEPIRPLVGDYDAVVAARVADWITSATGEEVQPRPETLPPADPPGPARLEALFRTAVVLEMASGGEIVIGLRPDEAATNTARFARMARDGWFDGLTFHRVVPNFIIQGGSPGANEYAGAPRYSRDELGRASHRSGTVGLSTRGRDTGDGQIFVNLVDNPRLDFEYTVFAEVLEGLEVARRVLEGDVIRRARVEEREQPAETHRPPPP